jgi:hypothetical protein
MLGGPKEAELHMSLSRKFAGLIHGNPPLDQSLQAKFEKKLDAHAG